MENFEFVRVDRYIVNVEAKTKQEAIKKVNNEDSYLNDGSFLCSHFELLDDIKENYEDDYNEWKEQDKDEVRK